MIMKKFLKFACVLIMGALVHSCASDGTEPDPIPTYGDVTVDFKVENGSDFTLADRFGTMEFVATATFPENLQDFETPVIELSMHEFLSVERGNVTLVGVDGAPTSVALLRVTGSDVTATFIKDHTGTFGYLRGAQYKITLETYVKGAVTNAELEELEEEGMASSARFHDGEESTTPVTATVYPTPASTDHEPDYPIQGVMLSLGATVEGKPQLVMRQSYDWLNYTVTLTTNSRASLWSQPTLELIYDEVLMMERSAVEIKDKRGNAIQFDMVPDSGGGRVKLVLKKAFGAFVYLASDVITVTVKTRVRDDVPDSELEQFEQEGLLFTARFWSNDPEVDVEAEQPVEIVTDIPDFNYTPTDTYDYPYKLNIVYFVPKDVTPNPGYQKRLSRILIMFQNFVHHWTKHWGLGDGSFGLPYNEDGLLDMVTVRGSGNAAEYTGDAKMRTDINLHYTANGITRTNDHILVIACSNIPKGSPGYPFYGSGDWCFAVDYPRMDENLQTFKESALAGGLLHEAGHGALDLPHVGPSYSQNLDSSLGMTLMGAGNMSYGNSPTFFHKASAATLAAAQLSARQTGTFYNGATTNISSPTVTDNGDGTVTVSGTFTTNKTANHIVVRFFKSTEDFLGGSAGYTSVAQVADNNGGSYETTFDISDIRGAAKPPQQPPHRQVKLGVTVLNTNGHHESLAMVPAWDLVSNVGIWTMDDGAPIDRTGWTVTASQNPLTDDKGATKFENRTSNLVDDNGSSFLSMVKAGFGYAGVSVPAGTPIWTVIDMQKNVTFKTIRLTFRTDSGTKALRNDGVTFHTSDDGENWTLLRDATLDVNLGVNDIKFSTPVTTRYLKMDWDEYSTTDRGAACLGFSDLSLLEK